MLESDQGAATLERPVAKAAAPDGHVHQDRLAGTPTSRRDVLAALLVGVTVVVVAVVWRSPVVPSDPWHYVQRAMDFPDRVWVPLGYTRYGIIIPNIVPAKIFGNAQVSYYFWPLISAGVLAAVTYLMGRRWWGPPAGLVAVVLLFSNTLVFTHLTRQYPDIMAMTLVFTGAFCALMARDRDFRGRAAVLWLLGAGTCLGWSFEVRETALFAWPLVIVLLWRRGAVLRVLGIVAVPVLAWAALDIAIGAVAYDDPLLKLHTFLGFGSGGPEPGSAAEAALEARTRLYYLQALPQAVLGRPDGKWMLFTAAVAVCALAVRNWPLRLILGSFLSILALNLLAGGVLFPTRPFGSLLNSRYWIQYIPSLALGIAGLSSLAVAWLARRMHNPSSRARNLLAAAVAVAVCAVPVWTAARWVPTVEAFAPNGGDALEDLRTHLAQADHRGGEMWTDWETKRLLPIYQRGPFGGDVLWSAKPRSLTSGKQPGPGDSVLLFSAQDQTCVLCRWALKPWASQHVTVPSNWRLVYESETGNVEMYSVS
jgi:Dolichyl-phosphate-mannose-protein mannosyltransferase